jgi:hypothetical protein
MSVTYTLLLTKLDFGGHKASYLNTGSLIDLLTFQTTVVNICTACFHIKRLFILPM